MYGFLFIKSAILHRIPQIIWMDIVLICWGLIIAFFFYCMDFYVKYMNFYIVCMDF